MDPLFERRELTRNVHLYSRTLQKNMLQPLLKQLRMNLEGHCSSEGFIQQQSITILKYSILSLYFSISLFDSIGFTSLAVDNVI